jgi:hypothetical protein
MFRFVLFPFSLYTATRWWCIIKWQRLRLNTKSPHDYNYLFSRENHRFVFIQCVMLFINRVYGIDRGIVREWCRMLCEKLVFPRKNIQNSKKYSYITSLSFIHVIHVQPPSISDHNLCRNLSYNSIKILLPSCFINHLKFRQWNVEKFYNSLHDLWTRPLAENILRRSTTTFIDPQQRRTLLLLKLEPHV